MNEFVSRYNKYNIWTQFMVITSKIIRLIVFQSPKHHPYTTVLFLNSPLSMTSNFLMWYSWLSRPTQWTATSGSRGWTGGWLSTTRPRRRLPSVFPCWRRSGSRTPTSTTASRATCTPSPPPISLWGFSKMGGYSTPQGTSYILVVIS